MATSGTIYGSCTGGNGSKYDFWASWVRNSYSVDNGTSNITVSLNVKRNDGYAESGFNLERKPLVSLKVNGSAESPSIDFIDTRNSKVCNFATWTGDVTHKDDGTLTCPIVASFSLSGVSSLTGGSLSGYATLDDIPRASTFTVDKAVLNFGEKLTISISPKTPAFTHDLYYALTPFGEGKTVAEGVIETNVEDSKQWEIPSTLAKKMPNKTIGYLTVICITRFKDTISEVGKYVQDVTVTVPDNTTFQPKISSVDLTCESDLPDEKEVFKGLYIAGKTKVKVKTVASTEYSNIVSTTVSIDGKTYSGEEITSDYLLNPGKNDVIVTVKDARGYLSKYQTSIQVIDYDSPRIVPVSGESGIVCSRCTAIGTPSIRGEFLLIKAKRSYYKVISDKQNNFCSLEYRYKRSSGAGFSEWVKLIEKDDSTDSFSGKVDGIVLSNRRSYVVEIRAVDDIEKDPDPLSFKIATAFVTFHLGKGGRRVAIGKVAEEDNLFDVALDTRFGGNVIGRVLGLGKLLALRSGDNVDALVEIGAYSIPTTALAQSILNLPVPYAGLFRVYSANGTGNTTGNWVYINQEYIPIGGSIIYRRALSTDGTGTWEVGDWYKFSGTKVT